MFKKLSFLLVICAVLVLMPNVSAQYDCADFNSDGYINAIDLQLLMDYIARYQLIPAEPYGLGDVNGDGKINAADFDYLIKRLFMGGINLCASKKTTALQSSQNSNSTIRVGNPPYNLYPNSDSISIPIYIISSVDIRTFTFGFQTSYDIEITSINTVGAIRTDIIDRYNGGENRVQVSWFGIFNNIYVSEVNSEVLLVKLNAQILVPGAELRATLDSSYFDPGGEFIIVEPDVSYFTPDYDALSCCINLRGNADGDLGDKTDVDDLVYMVDFAFKGGPGVACLDEGDVDASGLIDVDDLVFMVDFAFKGGPAPGGCQ